MLLLLWGDGLVDDTRREEELLLDGFRCFDELDELLLDGLRCFDELDELLLGLLELLLGLLLDGLSFEEELDERLPLSFCDELEVRGGSANDTRFLLLNKSILSPPSAREDFSGDLSGRERCELLPRDDDGF